MPAQPLITNYDVSQIFLGKNYYEDYSYTNTTGSQVTINPGTLMGKIFASNKVFPTASTSSDGSELPIGVAADTYVVANGATVTITVCTKGEVNQNKLILAVGDTLATVIGTPTNGGGVLVDLIRRNTFILLIPCTELSNTDNQ